MNAFVFDTRRFAEVFSEALSEAVAGAMATKTDLDHAVATLREEIKESQVTIIKWLVPLLLGQTAVIVALVELL